MAAPRTVLAASEAAAERRAHEERADTLTAGHRERRRRGEKHPVEDFLFTYYPFSPARLRRWHPGWQFAYDAAADPGADEGTVGDVHEGERSWYRDQEAGEIIARRADVDRYLAERADALGFMARLLRASSLQERRPNFGCFGLHEWAMVYRLPDGAQRHEDLPLRLGRERSDAVVEKERLVCSHVDAFRFFTEDATPRNSLTPTRATQVRRDNPACLHVGMDLYKWAMKLVPLVPSDLVLDCFEHARSTRVLDMEASPYDVRPLGYGVVPIESESGKAEYARRQRELAAGADVLRERILEVIEPLAALVTPPSD
ncbi:3-methyladenine DNA glycosylase [Brachybacterium endophyticum]|uniref:3-methyladenine DNA glycosylase n=1 Tax=Brachybacterium endophyticum TaxID=2182385 RepID=A0A2U2RI46_9MICO|nr:3-methyladenine DNA glycosylase [Brachybacterium endophyticum]PWH05454.1 3-methyladenine DNA glycosylase [Brachybacterium endophyticum]